MSKLSLQISRRTFWKVDKRVTANGHKYNVWLYVQGVCFQFLPDETTATKVYGTHWTPVSRYSDSFNYELTELDGGAKCGVKGYSRSDTWYAVLDYGTNFCNVRNLLDGAFESVWQHPEDVARSVEYFFLGVRMFQQNNFGMGIKCSIVFSLDQWQGFSEVTNDSRCTQYTSRDCTRYWVAV